MARVLAFDTSAASTSVAVCDGVRVLVEAETDQATAQHAELLLPSVERCLAQCGMQLSDVDVLAVGIGPGSFTGVRVGVATAKGLGLCLGKPVLGVVSLTALAEAASEAAPAGLATLLAPLLDAFKGELFGAVYRVTGQTVAMELPPFHAPALDALARIRAAVQGRAVAVYGAGYRRYASELGVLPDGVSVLAAGFDAPRARHVAALGLRAFERGEVLDLAELAPLYVRDSDAQLPKVPLRL